MLENAKPNYAFIDAQNLHLGSRDSNFNLSYKRFRVYLKEKYNVKRAYLFIGYLPENRDLYDSRQEEGYILKFKPVLVAKDSRRQKGDVDADLAFNVMRYYNEYGKVILITSDGDFDTLVKYLNKKGKLAAVISPNKAKCSALLKKAAQGKMYYLEDFGPKIMKEHR
ncbi:MAG: NYN domain-containing protein [Candidatus Vogelbacteria bacterium]|nr:NYN domain-containing protein [Candidatus Vogelbacteria bacterium]